MGDSGEDLDLDFVPVLVFSPNSSIHGPLRSWCWDTISCNHTRSAGVINTTMKLPLIITLAFLPCLALAQSTTDTNQTSGTAPKQWEHHQQSPEQQLAWLTTKLTLSDTQQGQIGPVLVSRDAQLKTIHEDASLTDAQKHEKIKALMESTNQQIESFLNPAQVAQFKELHQHHDKPAPQQ